MRAHKTIYGASRVNTQQKSLEDQPRELKIEYLAELKVYILLGTFWGGISLKSTSHALLNTPEHGEKSEEYWGKIVSNNGYKRRWRAEDGQKHTSNTTNKYLFRLSINISLF